MNKLKNNFLDILFFYVYHIIALIISMVLVFSLATGINVFDIEQMLKRISSSNQKEELKTSAPNNKKIKEVTAKVIQVRGTVFAIKEKSEPQQLKVGDKISADSIVETKEKSTVLLVFGDGYDCKVRLGNSSKLKLWELMGLSKEIEIKDKSLFNLVKGFLQLSLVNSNKKASLRFTTKLASFGVRGTQFVLMTDDENYSALLLKEGQVEKENYTNLSKAMISQNQTYFIYKSGQEKIIDDSKLLSKINWDISQDLEQHMSLSDFTEDIDELIKNFNQDDISTKSTDTVPANSIEEIIASFAGENKNLEIDLELLEKEIFRLEEEMKKNKPQLESDIDCLSRSKKQCNLFSEKILLLRGFPRTFGAPNYIQMLIKDLANYIADKQQEIVDAKANQQKKRDILQDRIIRLEMANKKFQSKAEPEEILKILDQKKN